MTAYHLRSLLKDKEVKLVFDNPCIIPLKDCESDVTGISLHKAFALSGMDKRNGLQRQSTYPRTRLPAMMNGRWEATSPKPSRSKRRGVAENAKGAPPSIPARKQSMDRTAKLATGLTIPRRRQSVEVQEHKRTSHMLSDAIGAVDLEEGPMNDSCSNNATGSGSPRMPIRRQSVETESSAAIAVAMTKAVGAINLEYVSEDDQDEVESVTSS